MRLIETEDDIAEGLAALARADARLRPVIAAAGAVPLRRRPPGFGSLVSIVVSQQVSRASADAIMGRLNLLVDPLEPAALLAAGDAAMRQAGLSRPKQRTVEAIASEIAGGRLDLDALAAAPPEEATARLTALPGIGPWTAEVYLLFCLGHPDIFPARDLALQAAVAHALSLAARPDHRALAATAESWAPWRGVAARLFWAYYASYRGREGVPAG